MELELNLHMKSSDERRQQMWVILSDYTRHLDHIWYRAQETAIMAECPKFTYDENPRRQQPY